MNEKFTTGTSLIIDAYRTFDDMHDESNERIVAINKTSKELRKDVTSPEDSLALDTMHKEDLKIIDDDLSQRVDYILKVVRSSEVNPDDINTAKQEYLSTIEGAEARVSASKKLTAYTLMMLHYGGNGHMNSFDSMSVLTGDRQSPFANEYGYHNKISGAWISWSDIDEAQIEMANQVDREPIVTASVPATTIGDTVRKSYKGCKDEEDYTGNIIPITGHTKNIIRDESGAISDIEYLRFPGTLSLETTISERDASEIDRIANSSPEGRVSVQAAGGNRTHIFDTFKPQHGNPVPVSVAARQ